MNDFDLQSVLDQIMNGDDDHAPLVDKKQQVANPKDNNADNPTSTVPVQIRPTPTSARSRIPLRGTELATPKQSVTAPADTTTVTGASNGEKETRVTGGVLVAKQTVRPQAAALPVDGLGDESGQDVDINVAAGRPPVVSFPRFTTEDVAAQLDIRNFATLCRLKVRKWVGRKRDKGAAKKAESDHGSVDGTYTAYKKLFAGTEDKLKAVNSVLDSARTRHYQMTLPWSTTGMDDSGRRDGPRLLANTLFMEYITEMGQAKQLVNTKREELREAFPELIKEARRNLGEAFVITDYPTPDDLESMFNLDFEFSPVPDGMDFKGLPAQQARKLADALTAQRNKCLEGAMQDVWRRMRDVVAKMADRLGDPKHTFHDTLVSNVRETVDLLTHLNATNDATIESIRQRIEKDLCKHDPNTLRNDLRKRQLTASLAGNILEDMDRKAGSFS